MKNALTSLAVILAFACLNVDCIQLKDNVPIIQTPYGSIKGASTDRVYMYLGIPFAQPPVNDLRWKASLPVKPWSPNVLNATAYQAACPQLNCAQHMPSATCPTEISEDCLYLNVFVPKTASSAPRAVMLFIHGGNFQYQGADSLLIDGQYFANYSDVIIVTIQYRLGALGFLVTGLEPDQVNGNMGLLDQRLAIRWIKNNIKSFGGDDSKITLFGQSAGAQSTTIHYLSADMQDTFNNVIIQSAPMAIPFRKFTEAMTIYLDFAQLLNCAARDVACLRSKSVNDILEAQFAVEKKITSLKLLEFFEPWLPWLDGNLVKGQLLELNKWNLATKYAYKPFIIGTLSEECYIYIYSAFTKPITTQFYLEIVTAAFKQHVIDTVKNFPPDFSKTDQRDLTSVLATDWVFACGSRNFLEQIYKSPASKGNNYFMNVFDYAVDFPGWDNFTYCNTHVCHGSDIPFTFDTADTNFTAIGKSIARSHMTYWSNFAKYSNPSPSFAQSPMKGNNPVWTAYDLNNKPFLRFTGPTNRLENNYLQKACDFFDTIGYYY